MQEYWPKAKLGGIIRNYKIMGNSHFLPERPTPMGTPHHSPGGLEREFEPACCHRGGNSGPERRRTEPAQAGGHGPRWIGGAAVSGWMVALLVVAGCAADQPKSSAPVITLTPPTAPAAAPAPATPTKSLLPAGAAKAPAPFVGEGWEALFDGKSLKGWCVAPYGAHGEVQCEQGVILLNSGDPFTGVNFTNDVPKMNYEVAFDGMRVSGSDFFCALTVPVGDDFCTLIVGGWGGGLIGISSLDGMDASENQTTKFHEFDQGRWYRVRLRVTQGRIEGWLDEEKLIDVVTTGKKISLRPGDIEMSKPFGLASYQTTAALREIRLRRVNTPADPAKRRYD